jgi:hypothetical protein
MDGGGCAQNKKIQLASGAALMILLHCRYCQQQFQRFLFRPQQTVCSQRDCQRRRRTDYHRLKVQSDSEYAQVVRDSRKKWRDAHPDYQKNYWQTHPEAARHNRERQQQRDQKRRVQKLVKNNSALDLKHSPAQVWLVGPAADVLVKNTLASSNLFIFQPLELGAAAGGAS